MLHNVPQTETAAERNRVAQDQHNISHLGEVIFDSPFQ